MFRIRETVHEHRADIARIITDQHGKVLSDAMGEVARGLENIEFATGVPHLLKGGFTEQASTGVDVYSIRQPLGVVAGITPFNFPAMVPMWMFANAIACGNTFVLKPSEKDPGASLYVAELLKDAGLPDGVLNVVQGDKVVVDRLLEHPDVEAVSFVGSTPIAKYIYSTGTAQREARPGARGREEPHGRAARRRHRHGCRRGRLGRLRLGRRAMHGDQRRGGRRRRGGSPRRRDQGAPSLGEDRPRRGARVRDGAARDAGASRPGRRLPRLREGTRRDVVEDGRELGLYRESDGFFLGVSLLDHVTTDMDAYKDEIFGPVLEVMRVDTYDEALQLVNDNPYGNGTAIFTRDGGAARAFQFDAQAGMVGVNVPIPVPVGYYSFGGWKDSLFGDNHMYGPEGINFYTKGKVVTERWPDPGTSSVDLGFPRTR